MTGSAISRTPLSHSPSSTSTTATPFTRKTMSVTQTYYLAHTARGKLAYEAGRPSHNLRLLVGHANLLDSLMVELAEAEREQESWFNQSVRGATKGEDRRVQWADQADTIVEDPEDDWQAEDADFDSSDSEYDSEEDVDMESAGTMSLHRVSSHSVIFSEEEIEIEDDGEEDLESLALHLTPSRSQQPPELDHDSDSSEDESMPPSPPSTSLPTFSEKQRQQIATTSFYDSKPQTSIIPVSEQAAFLDEGYYLPQRQNAWFDIRSKRVLSDSWSSGSLVYWFMRQSLKHLSEFLAMKRSGSFGHTAGFAWAFGMAFTQKYLFFVNEIIWGLGIMAMMGKIITGNSHHSWS